MRDRLTSHNFAELSIHYLSFAIVYDYLGDYQQALEQLNKSIQQAVEGYGKDYSTAQVDREFLNTLEEKIRSEGTKNI